MAQKMVTLIAVGALAGKSGTFGGFKFEDGKTEVPAGLEDPIRMLGALYNAHPEGSEELEAAEANIEAERAKRGGKPFAWEGGKEERTAPSGPPEVSESMTAAQIRSLAKEHFNVDLSGSKADLIEQYNELLTKPQ